MAVINIIWKVDPPPTGRYKSFEARRWPSASFKNTDEQPASYLACADKYTPVRAKAGSHAELEVFVALYTGKYFKWRRLKARAKTLQEAKQIVLNYWNSEAAKQYLPEGLK